MSQTADKAGEPKRRMDAGSSLRIVAVCVGVAVVIGVSGGMGDLGHAVEWLAESVLGALVGIATGRWVVPARWYDQPWKAALTIAGAVTPPIAAVVVGVQVLGDHQPLTAGFVLHVLPTVFAISLVMTAIALLVRRHPTQTHAAPLNAPPPKFLARLPAKLAGAELYAVEAEDHYLRLHTSLGQDLMLMRLADAIVELEGLEGAQTHRSWWVARAAVTSVERADGRAVLTLKDGAEAPVSRGYARALRAAGWF